MNIKITPKMKSHEIKRLLIIKLKTQSTLAGENISLIEECLNQVHGRAIKETTGKIRTKLGFYDEDADLMLTQEFTK